MDTNDHYITRNLILGFLIKQRIELRSSDLDSLLHLFPLSDNNTDLKKLVILKELELQVLKKRVSETLLYYIAQLAEIELERGVTTVSDAMKHAYCAVQVECSLRLLKIWDDGDNDCRDALKRIWSGRIGSKRKGVNLLDSEELWEWNDKIEAAIIDFDIRHSILKNVEDFDAIGAVKAYLIEEEREMEPSFLELLASKCDEDDWKLHGLLRIHTHVISEQKPNICLETQPESNCSDQIKENGVLKEKQNMSISDFIVRDVQNADHCTAHVTEESENANEVAKEVSGIDRNVKKDSRNGIKQIPTGKNVTNVHVMEDEDLNSPIAYAANERQGKGIHLRHKLVGLRRSTRGHGCRSVRGEKLAASDLTEADSSQGNKNLPSSSDVKRVQNALKSTSSDLHALVNDPLPEALKFAETVCGLQAESSVPVCDVNGDFRTRSMMDRNSTAHTIRWEDDSISESEDEKTDSKYGLHLATPRVIKVPPLKIYQPNKKRRATRRWNVFEEHTLRTGVEKYGRGNWKTILNAYKDVFEDRTEVDLKDKWRNLTRC